MRTFARSNQSALIAAPPQLVAGFLLLSVAWWMAWFGNPPLSEHTFFPIWLGYVLLVDGIVFRRTGSSLLARNRVEFVGLFLASIPLWWTFELANHFIGNWRYFRPHESNSLLLRIEASLSFSTVIPAVFETAEFYATTWIGRRPWRLVRIDPSRRGLMIVSLAGFLMFFLSLAVPRYFFPLVWIGGFFAIDPINALLGPPSLAKQASVNRWDTVVILFAAGITCGFFWEMWNYWSMPKWVYEISFAERFHIFEMPVLGYGGYFPFALEVYAAYNFLRFLVGKRDLGFFRFEDWAHRSSLER
jgi:hypothetical protein